MVAPRACGVKRRTGRAARHSAEWQTRQIGRFADAREKKYGILDRMGLKR